MMQRNTSKVFNKPPVAILGGFFNDYSGYAERDCE